MKTDKDKRVPLSTRLKPHVIKALTDLAAHERRNLCQLVAILLEDALVNRGILGAEINFSPPKKGGGRK